MNFKTKIIFPFIAFLLGAAILFPFTIQLIHLLEQHEHYSCKEVATHIHEKEMECYIYDFQFSPFQYSFFNSPEFLKSIKQSLEISFYLPNRPTNNYYCFFLRGPPLLS